MPTQYEPPIRFHDWERPTRDGPMRPPEHIEDWVPCQEEIPPGPSPQAVRVIRKRQETVTFRLLTTQPYRVGRHPNCQLYFRDDRVSRQHGLLYFASEISGWVYRDAKSTTGTFIRRSDAPAERKPVGHGRPIGIVAGQILELADGENRLEFLETVPPELIGASGEVAWRSNAGRALEKSVQDAARKSGPVVLLGPSGSGKTYLAQQIHNLSERKGSFVSLNGGLLPKNSQEFQSELIGHVKGAYTGAIARRDGALFQADEGTLFLDEVESLPGESQVFLLNLLEGDGEVRLLGSDKARPRPKVRFICSTKVPLDDTSLREDLVNRLVRGHRIVIPTLAERREDIPLLVANILEDIRKAAGVEATVTPEGMDFLMAQSWPGHVRQLKGALDSTTDGHQDKPIVLGAEQFRDYLAWEDAVRRGQKRDRPAPTIQATVTLTGAAPASPTGVPRKRPTDLTREDVERALREAGNVMRRAAELLGCSPTTLREKRKQFGL
jgi:DNA-binding NtrC family response regulator